MRVCIVKKEDISNTGTKMVDWSRVVLGRWHENNRSKKCKIELSDNNSNNKKNWIGKKRNVEKEMYRTDDINTFIFLSCAGRKPFAQMFFYCCFIKCRRSTSCFMFVPVCLFVCFVMSSKLKIPFFCCSLCRRKLVGVGGDAFGWFWQCHVRLW